MGLDQIDQIRLDQTQIGLDGTGLDQIRQIGFIRLNQIKDQIDYSSQIGLDQIRLDWIALDQIRLDQTRLDQVRLDQIRLDQIKLG